MNIKLTKKAEEEQLKLIAKEIKSIEFSSMSINNGIKVSEKLGDVVVESERQELKVAMNPSTVEMTGDLSQLVLSATFQNSDVITSFSVREVNIYAIGNDDKKEYLYAYYTVGQDALAIAIVQDKSKPQYIPISVNISLSNIDEVNISVTDDILIVNHEEFTIYKKAIRDELDGMAFTPTLDTPKTSLFNIVSYSNKMQTLERGWYYLEMRGGGCNGNGVSSGGARGYAMFYLNSPSVGYFGSGASGQHNRLSGANNYSGGGGSSSALVAGVPYNCGGAGTFAIDINAHHGGGGGSWGAGGNVKGTSGPGYGGNGGYFGISGSINMGGSPSTIYSDIYSIGGNGAYGAGGAGGGSVGMVWSDSNTDRFTLGGISAVNTSKYATGGRGGGYTVDGKLTNPTCSSNMVALPEETGEGYIKLYKYNI